MISSTNLIILILIFCTNVVPIIFILFKNNDKNLVLPIALAKTGAIFSNILLFFCLLIIEDLKNKSEKCPQYEKIENVYKLKEN